MGRDAYCNCNCNCPVLAHGVPNAKLGLTSCNRQRTHRRHTLAVINQNTCGSRHKRLRQSENIVHSAG